MKKLDKNNPKEFYICECGENLTFIEPGETLDKYDNKILIAMKYYCKKCGNEYEISEELEIKEY